MNGPPTVPPSARLRRFALVSLGVTAFDVSVLGVLAGPVGLSAVAADAVAVGVASVASWGLHRLVAGADDPLLRWTRRPAAVLAVSLVTGALDVAVVSLVAGSSSVGAGSVGSGTLGTLLGAKVLALGVAGTARAVAYRAVLLGETRRGLAARRTGRQAPGELRLTVVVPAYREQERIGESVRRITEALQPVHADGGAEVVVVDDGSSDDTADAAEAAGARVVRLPVNRGKGAAVRAGVMVARGRTVAFTDADLAYPPSELLALLAEVESGWDVAAGTRHHAGSQERARASLVRWLSGRLFNLLTALVLLGQYRDTQCGCKAFRADVARQLFSHTRVDGFAFDVELFHLVERYRLSLSEVPVVLQASAGSTVRVGPHAVQMLRDLLRVRRWASQGAYDLVPARGRDDRSFVPKVSTGMDWR